MTERAAGDIEALARQALAISNFSQVAQDAMAEANRFAGQVVDRIVAELSRRRAILARREDALRACLRTGEASCETESRAVVLARRGVESAQTALRVAELARSRFQAPRTRYGRECVRLNADAKHLLSTMSADLESYLQGSRARPSSTPTGSRQTSSGADSQSLPEGWAHVPLNAIDDSDSPVSDAESFGKGYGPDDLRWAFGALHEVVLPAMSKGRGADYFHQRDQLEGRVGVRSYSDTFSGFFGKDAAIKLDPRGDGTYTVTNGYHRIWVAKQMGLNSVPGWIR